MHCWTVDRDRRREEEAASKAAVLLLPRASPGVAEIEPVRSGMRACAGRSTP